MRWKPQSTPSARRSLSLRHQCGHGGPGLSPRRCIRLPTHRLSTSVLARRSRCQRQIPSSTPTTVRSHANDAIKLALSSDGASTAAISSRHPTDRGHRRAPPRSGADDEGTRGLSRRAHARRPRVERRWATLILTPVTSIPRQTTGEPTRWLPPVSGCAGVNDIRGHNEPPLVDRAARPGSASGAVGHIGRRRRAQAHAIISRSTAHLPLQCRRTRSGQRRRVAVERHRRPSPTRRWSSGLCGVRLGPKSVTIGVDVTVIMRGVTCSLPRLS